MLRVLLCCGGGGGGGSGRRDTAASRPTRSARTTDRTADGDDAVEFESLLGANIDKDIERFGLDLDDDGDGSGEEEDDEFFGPVKRNGTSRSAGAGAGAGGVRQPRQPTAANAMSTDQIKRITTLVQHQVRTEDEVAEQAQQRDRELERSALYRQAAPASVTGTDSPPTLPQSLPVLPTDLGLEAEIDALIGDVHLPEDVDNVDVDELLSSAIPDVPLLAPPPPTHKAFSVTQDFDNFLIKLKQDMAAQGTPLNLPSAAGESA